MLCWLMLFGVSVLFVVLSWENIFLKFNNALSLCGLGRTHLNK